MAVDAPPAPPRLRTGPRHARRVRRLPVWITVIGWVIVGFLAVVAAMRVFAWDDLDLSAILNSVTAFVYLPAWIVLVVAAAGRRWVLATAALAVGVAQIVFMLPELTAAQPPPAWVAGAPTVRLFDANVYASNPSMAGYAREIKAYRPQLVTLEESVPHDVTQLEASGALAGLRYTVQVKRHDPAAFFIASAYPLTGVHVASLDGEPYLLTATVHFPWGTRPLWVVHTIGPVVKSFDRWRALLQAIDLQVQRNGVHHLLLVGDFNATWNNKGLREILDQGLTDGAAARGHPFQMTWSQIKPVIPPVVRIDHVLTGSGVAVSAIAAEEGPGSDHRDIEATVAFER